MRRAAAEHKLRRAQQRRPALVDDRGMQQPATDVHTKSVPDLDWLASGPAPNSDSIAAFVNRFGSRLLPAVQNDVAASLRSERPGLRCMAAVRMLMHLAHGVDTLAACALGSCLLQLQRNNWEELQAALGAMGPPAVATTLGSLIYALKQEGRWNGLMEAWQSAAEWLPELLEQQAYWNAGCFAAICCLRANDLTTARRFESTFPAGMAATAAQISVLRGQLESFARERVELDLRPSSATQAVEIWKRDIADNARYVERLRDTTATSSAAALGWAVELLPALLDELKSQHALAISEAPFDEKYRELARRTRDWRQQLRQFLSPGYDPEHVNEEWVSSLYAQAGFVQAGSVVGGDLAGLAPQLLSDVARALRWARRAGDAHTAWMLRWSAMVVYDRSGDGRRMSTAIGRLVRTLGSACRRASDSEVSGHIANYFGGLPSKAAQAHQHRPDVLLLAEAFELRRNRTLIAARSSLASGEPIKWGQREQLGAGTHYLAYTVLYEERQVHAVLATADGQVSAHQIRLVWDDLLRALPRLDPLEWRQRNPFSTPRPPLWESLAPLLAPVEAAISEGRVRVGDHLCIASEDPINLIPLQALPCAGQPLFRTTSLSRVASISDALQLAMVTPGRPAGAVALFVDAMHRDPLWRRNHFQTTVQVLQALVPTVEAVAPSCMTGSELVSFLKPASVVHLHAHGNFALGMNPLSHSGIVVSDRRGPPRLDGAIECLLTPQALLEAEPQLAGSHITLSACVSGQGLVGKGGDVLGMEMALRWLGARSLLATHWDVRSDDAAAFCNRFYHYWLGLGLGCGRAWQRAIEDLASPTAPFDEQARWCAFSLYGAWN